MRAVFTNFGTIGDFRPLLALAREFAEHGGTPVLAFPPFAESLVSSTAFEYRALGPDLRSLRDQVNLRWSETAGLYDSSDEMLSLLLPFHDAFDQTFQELKDVCRNADVLISGPAQPLAFIVHEITGIPFVSVQISHFGGSGGPALLKAGEQLINPFRQKLGLRPLNDPFTRGANSPQLAIYAMSAHLRPRPPDWPSHYHLTGFFFDEAERGWLPDRDLEKFLLEGEPPVVVTLGSMVHSDPNALVATLIEAMRIAGCRAVIQGLPPQSIPDRTIPNIIWVNFVPHGWLFARAACIVLHGGCGTAAATFRSGVPGIFIPHGDCYDQRYWAQLAFEAGCSVPAIQFADLTAVSLASAIRATVNNVDLCTAAAMLGAKIKKEPGVRQAVRLISEFVARAGLYQEG